VFTGIVGLAGVTAIETSVVHGLRSTTWIVAEAEKVPETAITAVVPAFTPVTTPAELTVANTGLAELQVTDEVRFLVVPSEYRPVACNDTASFTKRLLSELGVTVKLVNVAEPVPPPPLLCMPLQPTIKKRADKKIQILRRTCVPPREKVASKSGPGYLEPAHGRRLFDRSEMGA
jgi:hypothetical protein